MHAAAWKFGSVATISLWGCTSQVDDILEGSGGHAGTTATEQLPTPIACTNSDVTSYAYTGEQLELKPTATHVCWLTKVSGDGAAQPRAKVYSGFSPNWELSADAQGTEGEATAHCAPRACFFSDNPGYDVNWLSEDTVVGASAANGSCAVAQNSTWQGDATSILNGWEPHSQGNWHGKVSGVYDHALVQLKDNPAVYGWGETQDCTIDGYLRNTRYVSFFVGVPGGTHYAVYKGPYCSRCWGISPAGSYWSRSNDETFERNMAYVDEGICVFHYIGGYLKTASEYARIFKRYVPAVGRYQWVLRTQHGVGFTGTYIEAAAHCYLYDQSQSH